MGQKQPLDFQGALESADIRGDFYNVTWLGHTPLKFRFLQLHSSSFGWFIPSKRLVCGSRCGLHRAVGLGFVESSCSVQ